VLLVAIAALTASGRRRCGVAVSFLALAVAFAITTKELLQSVLASMLKAVTDPFSIGDRIEIGGFRGDVVDQNLLTTTMLEVGPEPAFHLRIGRKITFPNVRLLDSYVVNESYTGHYIVHAFAVPVGAEEDWRQAEAILLDAARAACEGFIEDARRSMKSLEEIHGLIWR
jgi:small-conductance mechanosensitive channel